MGNEVVLENLGDPVAWGLLDFLVELGPNFGVKTKKTLNERIKGK